MHPAQVLDLQADRGQRRRELVACRIGLDVLAQPVFGELHAAYLQERRATARRAWRQ